MNNIIDLLNNKEVINKLIHHTNICDKHIIQTRDSLLRSTSSCRFWQLKLCLITKFFNLYGIEGLFKVKILTQLCSILHSVMTDTNCMLYNLIIYNRPINLTFVEDISNLHTHPELQIQSYYLCLFNPEIYDGSISHFFTIIRKNNNYYINSSYGSDYVCVPQLTKKLNSHEFNNFCANINDKNSKYFITFFEKYFLYGNLRLRYDENTISEIDPGLKHKWIHPGEKHANEISIYNSNYKVGLINNYESMVEECFNIPSIQPVTLGRKRKSSKSKNHKKPKTPKKPKKPKKPKNPKNPKSLKQNTRKKKPTNTRKNTRKKK